MKKYCTNCGALTSEDDKFCHTCGAAQNWQESGGFFASSPTKNLTAGSIALDGAKKTDAEIVQELKTSYIQKRQLSSSAIISFALSYMIKTFILLLLFLIGLVFVPFLAGMAIALYLIMVSLVALIVFNNFSFSVDEIGFQMWHGVLNKQQVTIPYQRIQNVNITRSIVDRILGLASINIETSGSSEEISRMIAGSSSSVSEGHLPGVSLADAQKVHDLLLSKSNTP